MDRVWPSSVAKRVTVAVIGGLDPGGQAGLAADLAMGQRLGARLLPVCAARTAQSDRAWHGAWLASAPELTASLACLPVVHAVKTGMLGSTELGSVLLEWLRPLQVPLVVDPLARTSSGGWLWPTESPEAVRQWMRTTLLPAATVATPNWLELAWLSGQAPAELATLDAALAAAQRLPCAVVLKGGHAPAPWHGRDWVVNQQQVVALPDHPRWEGEHRGTGCRFATALAVRLARGEALATAAAHAGADVAAAVLAG